MLGQFLSISLKYSSSYSLLKTFLNNLFKQKTLSKSKVNCFHKIKEEKKVLDLALILQKSKTFLNLYFDKSFYEKFLQPFGVLLKLTCIFLVVL